MKCYLEFPDGKKTRLLKDFDHACMLYYNKYRKFYKECIVYNIFGDFETRIIEGSL